MYKNLIISVFDHNGSYFIDCVRSSTIYIFRWARTLLIAAELRNSVYRNFKEPSLGMSGVSGRNGLLIDVANLNLKISHLKANYKYSLGCDQLNEKANRFYLPTL